MMHWRDFGKNFFQIRLSHLFWNFTSVFKITSFPFFLFSVILCIVTFFVSQNSFFWDTIQLASRHAHWFYENGFKLENLIFPNEMDTGNHPTFGLYLAVIWKTFGKTLPVSHFAMLPFLIGIVYQLQKLMQFFFKPSILVHICVMLAVLIEPTLLGQSVLVSPDIALAFFYLLCINAILSRNRLLLALALLGLANISLRGSMLVIAVIICDTVLNLKYLKHSRQNESASWRMGIAYIPVAITMCSWYFYHYFQTGWIGYHSGSPWRGSFNVVSNLSELYHNIKMLIYVLFDYGKIVVWLLLLFILIRKVIKKEVFEPKLKQLLLLFIVPLILICPTKLFYVSLMASRYYLPVFIFLIILTAYLIFNFKNRMYRYALFGLALLSLFTGHFWVYPERISQNWEGTLAHLPYYDLRKKMINYIDEQNIPFEDIGSAFPNHSSRKHTDLIDDNRGFSPKNFTKNKYIFYSNVFNNFTVDELNELSAAWSVEREFSKFNIYVKLYKNPRLSRD